jgi:transcriptional regulator with XRE-family HTH domain
MHAPLRGRGENVWMNGRRTVGTHIAERRKALGLSQGDLAEALGVTRTVVSRWETGAQRPTADQLEDLARVLDDDGQLASLARYDDRDQPPLFEHPMSVGFLCRRVAESLIRHLSVDPDAWHGEPGYGWRHELDDATKPPSAWATAYGLRAVALSGRLDWRVDLPRVRDTIRRLELPGGGWTARELSAVARPEVTAVVVSALQDAGESPEFVTDRAALVLEMLDRQVSAVEHVRPYVLATSLLELSRLNVDEAAVRRHIEGLVDLSHDSGRARGWPVYVRPAGPAPGSASTVHTAVAVCALLSWADRLGDSRISEVADAGVSWLQQHADLELDDEEARTARVDGGSDALHLRHFTPAWVLLGLAAAGSDPTSALADRALRALLSYYRPDAALWRWPRAGGLCPAWMTYQGVAALTAWGACTEVS